MSVRKFTQWFMIALVFLGALGGVSALKSAFFHSEVVAAPDYSPMQKSAEYFMTLYLNWSGDLEDRQLKMKQIAPSIANFLTKGKQTVNFVSSGTPYFSKERGFVDVVVWTKIKSTNDQGKVVYYPRKYESTVLYALQEDGTYQIDSAPMLSIDRTMTKEKEQKLSASEQAVVSMIEPIFTVFIPAFLSGDMSTAQNLILPDSYIEPYAGEYKLKKIDNIRLRIPDGAKVGDYVADVTITVVDESLKQQMTMLLNLRVIQQGSNFYVLRAVS